MQNNETVIIFNFSIFGFHLFPYLYNAYLFLLSVMAQYLSNCFSQITTITSVKKIRSKVLLSDAREYFSSSVKCALTDDNRKSVVKNGKDSLEICRVVNGMWQISSGAWGKTDTDGVVNAMVQYVDAGFGTFDLADICNQSTLA